MSATFSISARQAYGVARVCRVWGLSRASFYRHRCPAPQVNFVPETGQFSY